MGEQVGRKVMDPSMEGLADKVTTHSAGRPDIAEDERPGHRLTAAVKDFKRSGGFRRLKEEQRSQAAENAAPLKAHKASGIDVRVVGQDTGRSHENERDRD